jgi:dienelactone hydrolase
MWYIVYKLLAYQSTDLLTILTTERIATMGFCWGFYRKFVYWSLFNIKKTLF